ncbi:MAG TPA: class I SAM-dependent methyltransferase [Aggregatilineales bacterium]|nr:class I SAM-dependent methyltransferase [Aggregatilineales bacterium]
MLTRTQEMQALHNNETNSFYDSIAEYYHLFFRDWEATIQREGSALRKIFRGQDVRSVLDASCGPGTQSIALARLDFDVTAADPSFGMLIKARQYAQQHNVADDITFVRAGFLELPFALVGPYDAVITKGNALPHLLSDAEITQALSNFYNLLRPGGSLVIGIRDFDFLLEDRPKFVPRYAHTDDPNQDHILFDVWDWHDDSPITVTFNTFIVSGKGEQYTANKYPVTYRALRREELERMLGEVGFVETKAETQLWEVVYTARKP